MKRRDTECDNIEGNRIFEGDLLQDRAGDVHSIYFDRGSFFLHNIKYDDDKMDIPMYMCKTFPKIIGRVKKKRISPATKFKI